MAKKSTKKVAPRKTASNLRNPTIYFFGEINEQNAGSFISALHDADMGDALISVMISSGGGDVNLGIAMADMIKSTQNKVLTIATGLVASAAVLPFLAGDYRLIQPSAQLFFHEVRASQDSEHGATVTEMGRVMSETKKLVGIYTNMVAENSLLTPNKVLNMCQEETYVSCQEAIQMGLSDGKYGHTATKKDNRNTALEMALSSLVRRVKENE